jgi:predicted nucleic acid-binding protein
MEQVMSKYLLYSNIFIYHLCDDPKIHYFFSKLSPVTDQLFYSFISSIELLGYSDLTYQEREKIDLLLNGFKKVGMNNDVEEIVIEIRKNKHLKIPDAIIAASAIYKKSILVTRNEKDFKDIPNLKVLNPFSE